MVFTNHAREALVFRKISEQETKQAINKPDFRKLSRGDTEILYRRFGDRYLKVVVRAGIKMVTVITEYWIEKERAQKEARE